MIGNRPVGGPHVVFVDQGRMLRLVVVSGVAWVPTMLGLWLYGLGAISFAIGIGLGLSGGIAAGAAIVTRTVRLRRRLVEHPGRSMTWSQLANPRENHANRWAMYDDLSAWLMKREWSGKLIVEFGGTNQVLRTFVPGADYRLMSYPEHDLQNLHRIGDDTFDLAILDQTLEHLRDPERALAEVRRILKPGGAAIITTPFLVPVHTGDGYGDYYRWTPDGLAATLERAGFEAEVRMWGNRRAATALIDDMYMSAETARRRGLPVSSEDTEAEFPVTVWALATAHKD